MPHCLKLTRLVESKVIVVSGVDCVMLGLALKVEVTELIKLTVNECHHIEYDDSGVPLMSVTESPRGNVVCRS